MGLLIKETTVMKTNKFIQTYTNIGGNAGNGGNWPSKVPNVPSGTHRGNAPARK